MVHSQVKSFTIKHWGFVLASPHALRVERADKVSQPGDATRDVRFRQRHRGSARGCFDAGQTGDFELLSKWSFQKVLLQF
jgi:hypothetical protein